MFEILFEILFGTRWNITAVSTLLTPMSTSMDQVDNQVIIGRTITSMINMVICTSEIKMATCMKLFTLSRTEIQMLWKLLKFFIQEMERPN